jgi:hypothetical protein
MKLPVLKKFISDALAIATPLSGNEKTGKIAATHVGTDRTCQTCKLKDPDPVTGKIPCYYRSGFRTAPLDARMNEAARVQKASLVRIAKAEARLIDRLLTGKKRDGSNRVTGRPLRIHVGGDTPTKEAAVIVAAAARRFTERVQAPAYTYTHSWRTVPRKAWSGVSVLASIESTADGRKALKRGYAPAVVVERFDGPKAFERDGVRWIPCPAQTRADVSCDSCRLCMNADALRDRGTGIAFAAHGNNTKATQAIVRAAVGCSKGTE